MQDIELLAKIRHNPDKGLSRLMEQYVKLVYAVVQSKLYNAGTNEDIEECVSDVFLDFYEKIELIDLSKGSIKGYLCAIAKYKAIDCYRKLIKQPDTVPEDEADVLSEPTVEDAFSKKQESQNLINCIHSLGEPDSEIFIRRYYRGQSTKEIAEVFNLKENTVDKRISRGLKKLRNRFGGVL